jgi:hypothetical protein
MTASTAARLVLPWKTRRILIAGVDILVVQGKHIKEARNERMCFDYSVFSSFVARSNPAG